jgi:hypothetical protein
MAAQMWTRAQVEATHPETGELMLMGSMTGISMSGRARVHAGRATEHRGVRVSPIEKE